MSRKKGILFIVVFLQVYASMQASSRSFKTRSNDGNDSEDRNLVMLVTVATNPILESAIKDPQQSAVAYYKELWKRFDAAITALHKTSYGSDYEKFIYNLVALRSILKKSNSVAEDTDDDRVVKSKQFRFADDTKFGVDNIRPSDSIESLVGALSEQARPEAVGAGNSIEVGWSTTSLNSSSSSSSNKKKSVKAVKNYKNQQQVPTKSQIVNGNNLSAHDLVSCDSLVCLDDNFADAARTSVVGTYNHKILFSLPKK